MTEKRFTMGYKVYRDNLTGERYDELTESYKVCHLLNELNDENEQLKNFIRKEFPKSHKHILEGLE